MGLNVHILCEPEEYPTLKKKIDLHFCALAEWNETDVSHEGTVLSGEDARQRRLELITKAHIVVLVLSPELRSFLNQEVDLYKILIDRMLAGELLILSVMFRRVGKEYWFYKDFKDLGGNLPINQWKDPDDAWYSVEQEYDESVKIYPTLCSRQKIRFEHLKRALAEFNFTRQFKYFESQKMPASAPQLARRPQLTSAPLAPPPVPGNRHVCGPD